MPKDKKFYSKVSIGPHTRILKSSSSYTVCFFLAVLPQIVMLFVTKSFDSLLIILCAIFGALFSETMSFIKKEGFVFSIANSVLIGTLVGFFLPSTYPPLSVFFITFVFVSSTKYLLGGSRARFNKVNSVVNTVWFNPVVVTLAAAWFIGHSYFPEVNNEIDTITKNPSLSLLADIAQNPIDQKITAFMNATVFRLAGVSIPSGFAAFLWDSHSIIPAFRFNALTILASLALLSFSFQNAIVSFIYLVVYAVCVKYAAPWLIGGAPHSGDLIMALFSSGTLFSLFFLVQFPGTMPFSAAGRILYAVLGGLFAFFFCGTGGSPIGAVMSVLFLNIVSPMIEAYENRENRERLEAVLAQSAKR